MGTPKLTGSGLVDCPLGGALPFVTVGTTSNNDYVIDGTDDYVQIQAAIDAMYAIGGGDVYVKKANIVFGSSGYIVIKERVRVHCEGMPHVGLAWGSSTFNASTVQCTRFVITNTSNSAVQMQAASAIFGAQFYYPNQPNSGSPVTYPYTIQTVNNIDCNSPTDVYIINCAFPNSYRAINHPGSGRCNIYDCSGYPIYKGITLTGNQERCIIKNCYFTPNAYCGNPSGDLSAWIYANSFGCALTRSDGTSIHHNLILGYKRGIDIDGSSESQSYGWDIHNNWIESCAIPINCNVATHIQIHHNLVQAGGLFGSANTDIGINLTSVFSPFVHNNYVMTGGNGILLDANCPFARVENNKVEFGLVSHDTTIKYGIKSLGGNSGINNNTVYTSIDGSVTYTYANGISVGAGINTANSNNVFFCAAGIELLASSSGIAIGNSVYSASIVDNSSGGWIASATMNKILP